MIERQCPTYPVYLPWGFRPLATAGVLVICNRLLQQGAKPALGIQDILEEFNLTEAAVEQHARGDLTEEERRLLDALGMGVETVDDAAARLRVPASDILAVLTGLEIRGLVQLDPGGRIREPLRR